MLKLFLSYQEIEVLVGAVAAYIKSKMPPAIQNSPMIKIYPVPRGGVPVACLLKSSLKELGVECKLVSIASDADCIIDDVIDSGETFRSYSNLKIPFIALHGNESWYTAWNIQMGSDAMLKAAVASLVPENTWIVYPWEVQDNVVETVEQNVIRIIQSFGEDPNRQGLKETPARVAKAWKHWCSGYNENPAEIMKVFEDGAETYDQMVTVKDIPFYSHCEHHMAPFFGSATISYIPNGRIVGLSKLSRLVGVFAKRLQVQERLTDQIADALVEHLKPVGVGVVIKARHMCMESRGICQQGHHTITTSLRGALKDDASVRAEFLEAVNGN